MEVWEGRALVPGERAARLVLDYAGLEEVAFLLQVNHFTHPGEGVFFVGEEGFQSDLGGAAVGDVAQVALEHGCVHTQHATWHGVFGVSVFKFYGLDEQGLDFFLECGSPETGILQLELVDQVDAEVAVHGLVAQDVLVLLGGAGHLVLPTQRQDLREANVEEKTFHQAGENDQRFEQGLVVFVCASVEVRVADGLDERDQEFVLHGSTAPRCRR